MMQVLKLFCAAHIDNYLFSFLNIYLDLAYFLNLYKISFKTSEAFLDIPSSFLFNFSISLI